MADPVVVNTSVPPESPTMSREQWIERFGEDAHQAVLTVATRTVDEMIARGALTVGPPRRWTVVYDDPHACARFEFTDIYAPTPELAAMRGAFLGILADPFATMGPTAYRGREATMGEREMAARSIAVVAARLGWATVTETTEEVASDGEAG